VNLARIEIAKPVPNPPGPTRARTVSLPVFATRNIAGFLSLLNGLLDQAGTATNDEAAAPPAKQSGTTLLPQAVATTRGATHTQAATRPRAATGQRPAPGPRAPSGLPAAAPKDNDDSSRNATDARLRDALFLPMAPGATVEPPILLQTLSGGFVGQASPAGSIGETRGPASLTTESQPATLESLGSTNTPSGTSILNGNPPNPAHNIAFALRLTWQPPAASRDPTPLIHSRSDAVLPAASSSRNPTDVASRTSQPEALSESASHTNSADLNNTAIPAPDPVTGDPQSNGKELFAYSNLSLLQSSLAHPLDLGSIDPEEGRSKSPEALEWIRPGRAMVTSAPLIQGPASDANTNPVEIDAKPVDFARDPASIPQKISSSSPLATYNPGAYREDVPVPSTETRADASTSPGPGPEQGRVPESETGRRSPKNIATPQATSPNDSRDMTGRDAANSESDRKSPRIPTTEKAPQIQTGNEPAGRGADGAALNQASGAMQIHTQNQTKTSAPETPLPSNDSLELETAGAVQPQSIREISFRLAGSSTNVDVQVAQRAGKVQVSVRTADPELAKSLQTNLGELVGQLEDKGFKTETWTPVTAQPGGGPVREPSNAANSQSQSNDSGSRGGQQDQPQGQQESNHQQQGRWKSQLEEETLSVPNTITQEEGEP
jgi:hypothetical protein